MAGVSELALMGRVVKLEDSDRLASVERVAKAEDSRAWAGANNLATGVGALTAAGAGGYAGLQGYGGMKARKRAGAETSRAAAAEQARSGFANDAANLRRQAQQQSAASARNAAKARAFSGDSPVGARPADIGPRPVADVNRRGLSRLVPGAKAAALRDFVGQSRSWHAAKPGFDAKNVSIDRQESIRARRRKLARTARGQGYAQRKQADALKAQAGQAHVNAQAQTATRDAARGQAASYTQRSTKAAGRMKTGGKIALGGAGLMALAGGSDAIRRRRDQNRVGKADGDKAWGAGNAAFGAAGGLGAAGGVGYAGYEGQNSYRRTQRAKGPMQRVVNTASDEVRHARVKEQEARGNASRMADAASQKERMANDYNRSPHTQAGEGRWRNDSRRARAAAADSFERATDAGAQTRAAASKLRVAQEAQEATRASAAAASRRAFTGGKVALGGAGVAGLAGLSEMARRKRADRVGKADGEKAWGAGNAAVGAAGGLGAAGALGYMGRQGMKNAKASFDYGAADHDFRQATAAAENLKAKGYDARVRGQRLSNDAARKERAANSRVFGPGKRRLRNDARAARANADAGFKWSDEINSEGRTHAARAKQAEQARDAAKARSATAVARSRTGGKVALGAAGVAGLAGISELARRKRYKE